jgi:hypothetical protein
MSRRVAQKKEREKRVKKAKAKEKARRASQPPPPRVVDPDYEEDYFTGSGYGSSFGPLGQDNPFFEEEFFAGFSVPD